MMAITMNGGVGLFVADAVDPADVDAHMARMTARVFAGDIAAARAGLHPMVEKPVSPFLDEAAEMDGTRPARMFWRITLPLLMPNLLVVIVLALIRAVQVFDEAYVLTGGGPVNTTAFLSQYLATMAVGQFDLGPAAAFSVTSPGSSSLDTPMTNQPRG